MADDLHRQIDERVAAALEADSIARIFTSLDEAARERIAQALGPFIYDRWRALRSPENYYTVRWTQDMADVNTSVSGSSATAAQRGFQNPTLPRWLDQVGGSSWLDPDDPQIVHFRGAGGGADCMFHYLVSECWATEVANGNGTEGQVLTSVTGCRYKVFSTVQGAVTDAATNPDGLGNGDPFTTLFGEVAIIYVCHGHYQEAITMSANQLIRFVGSGRNATVIGDATSTNPTLGVQQNCTIWAHGITWRCSSGSHAISLVDTLGLLYIWDCIIHSASSTRIGIESSGARFWSTLNVTQCVFTGASGGVGILTNAGTDQKIYGNVFDGITTGIRADENTWIYGNLFAGCPTGVSLLNGSQGIYVAGNHFEGTSCTAVKLETGAFQVENLFVINNTFGNDISGITAFFDASASGGSSSTLSESWIIHNNHGLSCSSAFVRWPAGAWSRTQSWIIRLTDNSVKNGGTWETGTRPGFLFSSGNWNGNVPIEGYVSRAMTSQLWYWIDDNDFQFGIIPFNCRFGDTLVQYPGSTHTITTAGTFTVELASDGTLSVTSGGPTPGRFPIVQFVTEMAGTAASYVSHINYAAIPFVGPGNTHDHNGGDGGTIDHGTLTGLGDPDHDEIADADNDTGWRSEQSADEDKLRARSGGTERVVIQAPSTSEGGILLRNIPHVKANGPGFLFENTGDAPDPGGIFLMFVSADLMQILRKTTAGNYFDTAGNYTPVLDIDRATGEVSIWGDVLMRDPAGTLARVLKLYDNDGSNYIGLRSPASAQTENWVVHLPSDDPAAGDFLKVTSVSSPDVITEWAAGTSGSVAHGDVTTSGMKATLALMAASGRPAATAGCARGSAETTTNKVNYDTLDFDQSTQEHASWAIIMPDNYDPAVDMTARFLWTTAASSGNVIWGIQALAVPDDGAIDQAFGTAVEVTDGFLAAGDVHISSATAGFAPGGTDGAGRLFVFRVYRKAADGGDTLNGDARLLGVQLEYGVTALSA